MFFAQEKMLFIHEYELFVQDIWIFALETKYNIKKICLL